MKTSWTGIFIDYAFNRTAVSRLVVGKRQKASNYSNFKRTSNLMACAILIDSLKHLVAGAKWARENYA